MARAESRSASSTRTDTTIQAMPVTTNTHHFGEFRATSSAESAVDWTVVMATSVPTLIEGAATLVSSADREEDGPQPSWHGGNVAQVPGRVPEVSASYRVHGVQP